MKLSDPTTWGIPLESIEINDPTWGLIEIQRWRLSQIFNGKGEIHDFKLFKKSKVKLAKKSKMLADKG